MPDTPRSEVDCMLDLCRAALTRGNPWSLATREALAVALILNRHEWLAQKKRSIVDALQDIGSSWAAKLGQVQARLEAEGLDQERIDAIVGKARVRPSVTTLDYAAQVLTHAWEVGYRSVAFTVQLVEHDGDTDHAPLRARITLAPQDAWTVIAALQEAHREAWALRGGPLDREETEEEPPAWIT